jgi:hypothetical protein
MAQMSLLRGPRSSAQLATELHTEFATSKLPYIANQVQRSVKRIFNAKHERTALNYKMVALHAKLANVNKIMSKRAMTQQLPLATPIVEEDELQDRIAAIANLEARIERIEARYKKGKNIQELVEKVPSSNVSQQIHRDHQSMKEEERKRLTNKPPKSIFEEKYTNLYRDTAYNDRLRDRMADYQRHKFEVCTILDPNRAVGFGRHLQASYRRPSCLRWKSRRSNIVCRRWMSTSEHSARSTTTRLNRIPRGQPSDHMINIVLHRYCT